MLKYAVLNDDNLVTNIIVATSKEIAQEVTASKCIFIEDGVSCNINFQWDGTSFIDPNLEVLPES